MAMKRWQDWVNALLGLWMVASPWILDFVDSDRVAAQSAWILGAAILVFAGIAIYVPKVWEEALNLILGVGLIASPWALGFADQQTPMTNAVVVGLLVIALCLWAMLKDTQVQKWWHERHETPHPR